MKTYKYVAFLPLGHFNSLYYIDYWNENKKHIVATPVFLYCRDEISSFSYPIMDKDNKFFIDKNLKIKLKL